MREQTGAKLEAIFRAVLKLPDTAQVTGMKHDSEPGWDSLAHALLMAAIESELGIEIDAGESLELTSYDAIADFLERRGL